MLQTRTMEKEKNPSDNVFFKRLKVLEILFFVFLFLIVARLLYIQIFKHSYYLSIANQNHFMEREIPASRGTIYDKNGNILALDVPTKTLYVYTKDVEDKEYTIKTISEVLNIPVNILRKKFEEANPLIQRKISVQQYDELTSKGLKGLLFEDDFQRVYPKGQFGCHVLGCVDVDGKGIEGVEYYYNNILSGKNGKFEWLRDGKGNYLTSLGRVISKPAKGMDVYLTIDSQIQNIVEDEIEGGFKKFHPSHISAMVVDPQTGEVLALANKPGYDPNEPGKVPVGFRKNYAVCDLFEPGSVFKIVTASAVLEEKKVRPAEPIFCENGKWFVRGHVLHDSHPEGTLSFEDVIIKSSNIGTVKLAMRLGEEKLYEYIKKFEFGQLTGIDLPGEIRGVVRPVDKWSDYSITAVPIGQEVSVTCLQAVKAMTVFANGGYLIQPHILEKTVYNGGIKYSEIKKTGPVFSGTTISTLDSILNKVVSAEGTASSARINGYKICGKTGTGQEFENGHYSHSKYFGSFVGFLPMQNPRVVIFVTLDDPKGAYYGGTVAAPTFRDIAWRIMQYYNIPPDTAKQTGAVSKTT